MKDKIILALDQSTKISGWAIYYGEKLTEFGHWTFKNEDVSVRIHRLCQEIQKKIESTEADFVVMENI